MKKTVSVVATVVALAVAVTVPVSAQSGAGQFRSIIVKLNAVGGSGQSGSASLLQLGPQLTISGSISGEPPNTMQPAHLYKGPCRSRSAEMLDLGATVDGTIGTRVLANSTVPKLHAMHASIAVEKSGRVVSCGNI